MGVTNFLETLVSYLRPSNTIAMSVVMFLIILFVIWLLALSFQAITIIRKRRLINKLSYVDALASFREGYTYVKKQNKHEKAFELFLSDNKVSRNSIIAKHIHTIFEAGIKGSQLEIASLLNHTNHQLFAANNLLKNVLSVFIIIGLLGTLFGLADSLAHLSLITDVNDTKQFKNDISFALRDLLVSLKSAFAPSIWGVMFTIAGVFAYGLYINFSCNPLKTSLEYKTLNVWLPELYPTTTQELYKTLQQSEQHMRENFKAAKEVANLAQSIKDETGDFKQNLKSANSLLVPLSITTEQLNTTSQLLDKDFCNRLMLFTSEFAKSVNSLTSFQAELRTLYDQMIKGSETLEQNLTRSLSVQQAEIHDIIFSIKKYEKSFLELQEKLDTNVLAFINEAKEATTSVSKSNRDIVEQNLKNLTASLNELNYILQTGLISILERFNRFDTPVKGAADKIESNFENYNKLIQGMLSELQKEIIQQGARYSQHLTEGNELKDRIEKLFTQVDINSAKQITSIDGFVKNVESLNATAAKLLQGTENMLTALQHSSDANSLSNNIPKLTAAINDLIQLIATGLSIDVVRPSVSMPSDGSGSKINKIMDKLRRKL
ncbi:MAG: MotA/TolQ/ExbB proton channel family protein [Nitrospirae bacterium]|nr:MotA/TolQ/ExbB proton channel family protein [Nitrospirota bacterium]